MLFEAKGVIEGVYIEEWRPNYRWGGLKEAFGAIVFNSEAFYEKSTPIPQHYMREEPKLSGGSQIDLKRAFWCAIGLSDICLSLLSTPRLPHDVRQNTSTKTCQSVAQRAVGAFRPCSQRVSC
jgi:hypothetical protein